MEFIRFLTVCRNFQWLSTILCRKRRACADNYGVDTAWPYIVGDDDDDDGQGDGHDADGDGARGDDVDGGNVDYDDVDANDCGRADDDNGWWW